jgi:zinc D-Ala-D-Ala carboxypeptidase
MALYTSAQQTANLKALGFRGTQKTMILNFQKGWNLGAWLATDGLYGPKTDSALKQSMANKSAGKGTCSLNFSFSEFQCKCGGKYSGCQGVWINRVHVKRLQTLRTKIGPLSINSGCRCAGHNKAVGGASSSQHMFGVACDIPGTQTTAKMRSFALFAGLGWSKSSGKVLHVDSRDVGGHNTTGGTPKQPTTWQYA